MGIKESGEMYLENILTLREKIENIRPVDIARQTGYSKPSITRALGVLRANGYIVTDKMGFITLTESGEAVAKKIFERHRLLTEYFILLGVGAETASEDACRIEHIISDETFEKIKLHTERLCGRID